MELVLCAPDLERLGRLKGDVLVLTFFEDERPLRGAAGLVDWRVAGFLSGLLRAGRISGAFGEKLLFPVRPRLDFARVLTFGLGQRGIFGANREREAARGIVQALEGLGAADFALDPPGRKFGRVPPRDAAETWRAVLRGRFEESVVTVIDTTESHADHRAILGAAQ